jgi:hypothetical protein
VNKEHTPPVEEIRNAFRILVGLREGNNHLKNLDVDERIHLKWILIGCECVNWILLTEDMAQCSDEPSGYVKGEAFLDHTGECQLLKKNSVP